MGHGLAHMNDSFHANTHRQIWSGAPRFDLTPRADDVHEPPVNISKIRALCFQPFLPEKGRVHPRCAGERRMTANHLIGAQAPRVGYVSHARVPWVSFERMKRSSPLPDSRQKDPNPGISFHHASQQHNHTQCPYLMQKSIDGRGRSTTRDDRRTSKTNRGQDSISLRAPVSLECAKCVIIQQLALS